MPAHHLVIDAMFNGPPESANGGYAAGLLARVAAIAPASPTTVTLRKPPPLGVTLDVDIDIADETARLLRGDEVVAEAIPGSFADGPPPPTAHADASAAEATYQGRHGHAFGTCFACGPDRALDDGLRLAPGLVAPGRTACTWTPSAAHANDDEIVHPEIVWAALDCPSAWTTDILVRPCVLGRMTAEVHTPVHAGANLVVVGALRDINGRKTLTSTAIYDDDGALVAQAEHLWIAIDPSNFGA